LPRNSVKSTLAANNQGSFDLSERSSISIGIFHARRPEKANTGGGVASTCSLPRGVYQRCRRVNSTTNQVKREWGDTNSLFLEIRETSNSTRPRLGLSCIHHVVMVRNLSCI
ncbi:hypothetical protein BDU57DRAFT_446411, partial [Ampelomyces quisqualis]